MRYAKLNADRTLALAPLWVVYGEQQIFNPSVDVLKALGYKPVTETPYPERKEDEEPVSYAAHYEEHGDEIVQVWEVEEPPNEETEAKE